MQLFRTAIFCFILIITTQSQSLVARQQATAPAIVDKKTAKTGEGTVTTGRFRVFENRNAGVGRQIHLDFVVLHAKSENPEPDPFFFFAGGPGQAVATMANRWAGSWIRNDRDIVLINQRGTSGDNRLAFETESGDDSLQQYLGSLWEPEVVKKNLARLSNKFDLTQYSTPIAMDDVNDFRQAMGYKQINISGASYGTRASLVYIRRHGETVRTAILSGCAPIEFRNPLYHAEGGQRALDSIFDEVERNPKLKKAFGDLRMKFETILKRLEEKPVTVEIMNTSTGKSEPIEMDRSMFESAVRFQMYYSGNSRRLPALLCDAYDGKFRPFVLSSLRQSIGLRQSLAMGMLLSVTTAEDVARIDPAEIDALTKNTFTGSGRVLAQMKAARLWPKSELPANYGEPVKSDVQTLVLSGSIDPVTPPKWGEMVHNSFPNSIHLVVPTAHDIGGPCVDRVKRQFLKSGKVAGLDTDCVKQMQLPPMQVRKSNN